MLGNKSLIGELQSRDLKTRIDSSINAVDLNWLGFSRKNLEKYLKERKNPIEVSGTDAHTNRVLLWLSSKPLDYVRESSKGGILQNYVGKLNKDTDLSIWEQQIRSSFNLEFASDLDLLYLKLSTDYTRKTLYINMIVRDVILNRTLPISTGVNLNA